MEKGSTSSDSRSSRDIVLNAAIAEFSEFGLSGGRIDRIAQRTNLNKQAIYYYFESKEALFTAALEYGYTQFRIEPTNWDECPSPIEALRDFIHAAFYAVQIHQAHAALIIEENRSGGRHIASSFRETVNSTSVEIIGTLREILERGQDQLLFSKDFTPENLYLDVMSMSFFIFDHRYTVGEAIRRNLADAAWLEQRCAHVQRVILAALTEKK